jgi:hypothetical protein
MSSAPVWQRLDPAAPDRACDQSWRRFGAQSALIWRDSINLFQRANSAAW